MTVYMRILDKNMVARTVRRPVMWGATIKDGCLVFAPEREINFGQSDAKYVAAHMELFDVDTDERIVVELTVAKKVAVGDVLSLGPDQFSASVDSWSVA